MKVVQKDRLLHEDSYLVDQGKDLVRRVQLESELREAGQISKGTHTVVLKQAAEKYAKLSLELERLVFPAIPYVEENKKEKLQTHGGYFKAVSELIQRAVSLVKVSKTHSSPFFHFILQIGNPAFSIREMAGVEMKGEAMKAEIEKDFNPVEEELISPYLSIVNRIDKSESREKVCEVLAEAYSGKPEVNIGIEKFKEYYVNAAGYLDFVTSIKGVAEDL